MEKVYIYDQRKAGYYMYMGVFPLNVGISDSTRKRFYVFSKQATNKVYEQWIEEVKNKEKNNGRKKLLSTSTI